MKTIVPARDHPTSPRGGGARGPARGTRSRWPLLAAAAMLAASGLGPGLETAARAQGLDDDDEPEARAAQAQPAFDIGEENFDRWVFGNLQNADAARTQLRTLSQLQVDEIDRVAALNEGQKRKLTLAAVGDMKRFFDLVEEKREAFQQVRHDQQKFAEFYQELRPLQVVVQGGAFGDGSIFAKTVKKALDAGQAARYDAVVRERRLLRHRAKVAMMLANLDNNLGLTAEQRRRFSTLIDEEVRPPKRPSSYDYYVLLHQLARMPEDRLRTIFNDVQWKTLGQLFATAKGIEPTLVKQDLLPDEPKGAPARPQAPMP